MEQEDDESPGLSTSTATDLRQGPVYECTPRSPDQGTTESAYNPILHSSSSLIIDTCA